MPTSKEAQISEKLRKAIDRFEKISLEDLPEGAQMERIDRKFPMHISQLPMVLEGMEREYQIVCAFGKLISPYDTLYLDTPDKKFYRIHHNGILHRDKIRFRSYPHTATTFLEVKRKNNKNRTAKWRIQVQDIHFPLTPVEKSFLMDRLSANVVNALQPSVRIKYYRMAFNSETEKERFSIDFQINGTLNEKEANFGNVAVLEVKQDQIHTSPIIKKMRDLKIREAGMSKYCLHLAMIDKEAKINRFKSALRSLKKIKQQ